LKRAKSPLARVESAGAWLLIQFVPVLQLLVAAVELQSMVIAFNRAEQLPTAPKAAAANKADLRWDRIFKPPGTSKKT
jgi:hypothetical protein